MKKKKEGKKTDEGSIQNLNSLNFFQNFLFFYFFQLKSTKL